MKKVDFTDDSKPLRNIQEGDTGVQFPKSLSFESKKEQQNYLKHSSKQSSKNKLSTLKNDKENTLKKDYKEKQFLDKSKSHKTIINIENNNTLAQLKDKTFDISESSCSECECGENMIPKKQWELKIEKRRRRKKDTTVFYDQIIYHNPGMRRINFVYSSSGSSDSEYENVYIKKDEIKTNKNSEKSSIQQHQKSQHSNEIPLPEHIIEVQLMAPPPPQQKELPKKTNQVKKPSQSQKLTKQPKIEKYRPKPPVEEWAKYETPGVVHPQQLTKPKKPTPKVDNKKPLYQKDRERLKFNVPKKEQAKNDFIPKALPTSTPQQIQQGQQLKKKKNLKDQDSSNSSCYLECECLSDACDC